MKWVSGLVLSAVAFGQQVDLSILDKLAARAKSSVNISLDEDKLKLASGFLSTDDPNQSAAKNVAGGLKGINVRVFEFDQPNQFSASDLDVIRKQLKDPGWTKIIEAKERDESAEIYMFGKGKDSTGLIIIAAERKELAVVNIIGPVDLNTLGSLAGKLGVPRGLVPPLIPKPPPPPPAKRED